MSENAETLKPSIDTLNTLSDAPQNVIKLTEANLNTLSESIAPLRKLAAQPDQKQIDEKIKQVYDNIAKNIEQVRKNTSLNPEQQKKMIQAFEKLRDSITRNLDLREIVTSTGNALARVDLLIRDNPTTTALSGAGGAAGFLTAAPQFWTALSNFDIRGAGRALWSATWRGIVGITAPIATAVGISFIPESFRKTVADTVSSMGQGIRDTLYNYVRPHLPSWMQSLFPEQTTKLTQEQIKKVEEQLLKQGPVTDGTIQAVRNYNEPGAQASLATTAIGEIDTEIGLINQLQSTPERANRLKTLNDARAEMVKIGGTPAPEQVKKSAEQNTKLSAADRLKIRQDQIRQNSQNLAGAVPTGSTVNITDTRLVNQADQQQNPNLLALNGRTLDLGEGMTLQFINIGNEQSTNYRLLVNGRQFKVEVDFIRWIDIGRILKTAQVTTINNQLYLRSNNPDDYYYPLAEIRRVVQTARGAPAGNTPVLMNNLEYFAPRGFTQGNTTTYPTAFSATRLSDGRSQEIVRNTINLRLTPQA